MRAVHLIVRNKEDDAFVVTGPDIFVSGNMFQNLMVSSPAPVIIVCPFADAVKNKTRAVWPVNVATRVMDGYLQTTTSLSE